jgi:hypothetical protein
MDEATLAPPLAPHRGALILVFGILSLVVCFPLGFFAWAMGNSDLRAIDAGQMDPEGRGLTQAGKICGIVGSILGVIGIVLGALWLIFAFVFLAGHH